MTSRPVDQVLAAVDSGLDQSLERLFALLRIPSVSTDSAYAAHCAAAADWLVQDLASIGFDAEARATGGHPAVVAKSPGGAGSHALFYGHYDVQPVDPLDHVGDAALRAAPRHGARRHRSGSSPAALPTTRARS
jgi:acetylornithine deacetylase/succinyl-diaminopimelate desuccinylase-like protein